MNCKPSTSRDRTDLLICLALIAVTLAVYLQTRGFGFVVLDDYSYIVTNHHVLGGLSLSSLEWAFTTFHQSNWHPLTWISLMLDAQIGGGAPGVFHMTNVALHVLNTLLLFALLKGLTGYRWRSAAVAVLFAIHPLHVESVAWVTERKDVLSTFFWLLTMLAYARYARQPSLKRYGLVLLAFALGLMAKPMLVTLPIVLLLMDIWPLGRVCKGIWPLVREKLPLFGMAAASCIVTYIAQAAGGSVVSIEKFSFGVRLANALVAYVSYIGKMVCPLNLVMLYPHPGNLLPVWQVIGSGLLLLAITVVAVKTMRSRPYLAVGWLWYLLTLLPVIGLLQVGRQSMADRYTYVPMIGLFIVLAWGVPELVGKLSGPEPKQSSILPAIGVVVLIGLMASAYFQVGYWRNSVSLCEHALNVDPGNYLAHMLRGDTYSLTGDAAAAVAEYGRGVELAGRSDPHTREMGRLLVKIGTQPEGGRFYSPELRKLRGTAGLHCDLGVVLLRSGNTADAIWHLHEALDENRDDPSLLNNLGCAYRKKGDLVEAEKQFRAALRLDPANRRIRQNLARIIHEERE